MAVITKCHHKYLKVVLAPDRDLEICMDCGEVVRDRPVNEKLPDYYARAWTRVKFETEFWGGSHHRAPERKIYYD